MDLQAPLIGSVHATIGIVVAALALNAVIAVAVAMWARRRRQSAFLAFYLSFFFSPFIALPVLIGLRAATRGRTT